MTGEILPFIEDMGRAYGLADLVISRAGATSIAEVIAAQKAAILVPFASAADNHQMLNARELEKAHAAEVIEEKDFNSKVLAEKILDFLNNKEKIEKMESNLSNLKTRHTAENISNLCLKLMESNT